MCLHVVVVVVQDKRTHAWVKHITMSDVQFTHFSSSTSYTFTGSKIDALLIDADSGDHELCNVQTQETIFTELLLSRTEEHNCTCMIVLNVVLYILQF